MERRKSTVLRKRLTVHLWQANILAFLFLVLIVAGGFGFQMKRLSLAFMDEAKDHARLAADIILLNTQNAIMAEDVTGKILATFLGNTARFVKYLESVEPFSEEELSAFSEESSLAGVGIIRSDGSRTEGPQGWSGGQHLEICTDNSGLTLLPAKHLFVFSTTMNSDAGCIYVGIKADRIEKLQRKIGLDRTLSEIRTLQGVNYARLIHQGQGSDSEWAYHGTGSNEPTTAFVVRDGSPVVEVCMLTRGGKLVIGMDAAPLHENRQRMWRYFIMFSGVLILVGVCLTLALYRHQTTYVKKIRDYERELSEQREDAALGRSAATIAHEIRNPLNSVAMGLQRLQIEAHDLPKNQRSLIKIMFEELKRTNKIISDMLAYSRPIEPANERIALAGIVQDQLSLMAGHFQDTDILVSEHLEDHAVRGDPDLLRQVVGNLLRNAAEAQSRGGKIEISVNREGGNVFLTVQNKGGVPEQEGIDRIFEPYYSTKTIGSGLGLAVCRRIIKAHGGNIHATLPQPDLFAIIVSLPAAES